MPLLAAFIAACINGLVAVFGTIMAAEQAMTWARRAFIISLTVAFMAAVKVCLSSLLAWVSTVGLPSRFLQGLGMFIPSNAVAVMSCIASVWLACVIYRVKVDGLRW